MKEIKIKKILLKTDPVDVNEVSTILNELEKHKLEFAPWKTFSYKPDVAFSIFYTPSHILLKYFVREKEIRAVVNETNGPVWEDSCVEFFISFDSAKGYYNFEFNCVGTCLVGYGSSKDDRHLLSPEFLKSLKIATNVNYNDPENINWELTVCIPLNLFIFSSLPELTGATYRANFYKCGDQLSSPHFVAWSEIISATPNFHLPEFFGKLDFE